MNIAWSVPLTSCWCGWKPGCYGRVDPDNRVSKSLYRKHVKVHELEQHTADLRRRAEILNKIIDRL